MTPRLDERALDRATPARQFLIERTDAAALGALGSLLRAWRLGSLVRMIDRIESHVRR